jgi:hypothetical protein
LLSREEEELHSQEGKTVSGKSFPLLQKDPDLVRENQVQRKRQ